jgi:nucleotide-binding universal stress UspA family protein
MARAAEKLKLEAFVRDLHFTEVETQCHVTSGIPHESIDTLAVDIDCDVIVVGSRAHRDWTAKLFGTVADRLIENSRKPVLTVPKLFSVAQPLSDLDRTLAQSFPASDASSSWAGPSS